MLQYIHTKVCRRHKMASIESIKMQIERFYRSGRRIHITAQLSSPKAVLANAPARITGVYPRLFIIKEASSGTAKTHTFQYTDVLTGVVKISEMSTEA